MPKAEKSKNFKGGGTEVTIRGTEGRMHGGTEVMINIENSKIGRTEKIKQGLGVFFQYAPI